MRLHLRDNSWREFRVQKLRGHLRRHGKASNDLAPAKTPVPLAPRCHFFARREPGKFGGIPQAGHPSLAQNEAVRALTDSMDAATDWSLQHPANLRALDRRL